MMFFQYIVTTTPSQNVFNTLVFLLLMAIRLVICIITAQNVRLVRRSFFKSLYFITIALYIYHV